MQSVALDTSRASGQFDTKDVGQGKAVTVTDFVLSDGADAANYRLADTTLMTSANIDRKALTVSGIRAVNKTYDGTPNATLDTSGHSLEGKVGSDDLGLDQSSGPSGLFADKNVGTGKTVTISGIALTGTDLDNYELTSTTATASADITARALTVSGISAVNKTYDGSTTATLDTRPHIIEGKVAGDDLWLDQSRGGPSGLFADRHRHRQSVTVSGIALTGTDRDNYELTSTTATASANITARMLTVNGIGAVDRPTTAAPTQCSTPPPHPRRQGGGDDLRLDQSRGGPSGLFADKNAGTGKTVAVIGIALTGTDRDNYS